MSEELGPIATVTHDGFSISSNEGSAKAIKDNLEADPAPLDGSPEDAAKDKDKAEKAKRSEAASELGKAGGKAAAEARKAKDDLEDEGDAPEAKEPEKKAAEAPEDDEEPIKGNPRRDAKARIQQLARERAAERARADALEARLAALETKPKATPDPDEGKGVTPPQDAGEPRPDAYETYEEYVKAVAKKAAREEREAVLREAQDKARLEAHTKQVVDRVEKFNERLKAFPDIAEKVDPRLLDIQPSFILPPGTTPGPLNDLAEELIDSESGPALMLYLTEHEDEVRRIIALPNSREISRAVARLENKLATGEPPAPVPEPEAKPSYSHAKPPVQPIRTSASTSEDELDDDAPFDKHYSLMQARDARLRRR